MSYTNPFIHEFYIDLTSGATKQREKKSLSQGDAYADKILVNVQDNGKPVYLDGIGVSAKVIRFDGKTVPLTGSVEGGAACIVLDDACYDVPGDIKVSIVLSAGEMVQTILVLTMNVDTSETSIIVDNGVIGDLTEILTAIADMRAATEDAHAAADDARNAVEDIVKDVDSAIADMSAKVNEAAPSIIQESSGGLVSISDAANRNAQAIVSEIKPSVDGVSSVTLIRTGKNLMGFKDFSVNANGVYTDIHADDVFRREVHQTHETINAIGISAFKNILNPHIPAGTYTFTLIHLNGVTYLNPYMEVTLSDGTIVNLASGVVTTLPLDGTITGIRMANRQYKAGDTIEFVMQLEAGAGTAYDPYNGLTLTAELPETVYGGTLDWTAGLLTITHGADGAALAAPVTHQFDAQTVEILKGHNAVWSDTGDTSLVYVADTKLYIDNAVAAIAAAIINN